jgi:hypothetical protein
VEVCADAVRKRRRRVLLDVRAPAERTVSLPTAITSLWNTPASIASGCCCANSVRPRAEVAARDRFLASRVCRPESGGAGARVERHAPVDEQLTPARCPRCKPRAIGRPSSRSRAGGNGSHREALSSAKIAAHARVVVAASIERWKCDEIRRREVDAAVRGRRWLTVAALATHIAAADEHAARSCGARCAAVARTSLSLPAKPSSRNAETSGRSCGGSTACANPRSASTFILASPCSAAWRGLATRLLLRSEARLPVARPL